MASSALIGAAIVVLVAAAALNSADVARSSTSKREIRGGNESDLVTGLPGQAAVGFRHYAGYVSIGSEGHKALFYWFFEAGGGGAAAKPLILWLNGGPGCSSVAYGATQELGPFLVSGDGPNANLTINPYSWNKVANLLFLEAPVGVGFSYTNRSSDLQHLGDRVTAHDSYDFLLHWFGRFPAFKSHDFYIAGESYAGHYVPQLADLIFEGNKNASEDEFINFKGLMVGNAVLNDDTDEKGMVDYAWSHAIISDQLYGAIRDRCSFFKVAKNDPKKKISNEEEDVKKSKQTAAVGGCSPVLKAFLHSYDDIDIYSIYTPVCPSSSESFNGETAGRSHSRHKLIAAPHHLSQHDEWHELIGRRRRIRSLPAGYDPCTENYAETYFNRADVQKALHANVTHLNYAYSPCSSVIETWNDSPSTVLPTLRKLMTAGYRVWVYSGDTDGRVPVTSTRYSINRMGLTVSDGGSGSPPSGWGGWRAWYHGGQVAGWVVEYKEGLTFATVRGAGHQVPVFAPAASLSLVSHFISGEPLPTSRAATAS